MNLIVRLFYVNNIMLITIGKKTFECQKEDNTYIFPRLVDKNKLGTNCFWEIYVTDNKIHRKSYQSNDKIREFTAIETLGKNIGKKNETSPNEQALFQAHTLWTKKQDQGYIGNEAISMMQYQVMQYKYAVSSTVLNKEAISSDAIILPMLANKYQDRGIKYLQLPFGISPKLDGIRVTASFNKRKELNLYSRLGKPFSFLDGVRSSLSVFLQGHQDIIVDGELYSHDLPFNQISGGC